MTTMREKISRYYRGQDEWDFVEHLLDVIEKTLKTQKFQMTDFLSPKEQEITNNIVANYDKLKVSFHGGYEGAERQIALIYYYDFSTLPLAGISLLDISFSANFQVITHRDILGSIMSLGVDRRYVGDILVGTNNAKILVREKMANYFLMNYKQINTSKIACTIGDLSTIVPKEARIKEIKRTVASLRLDAVVALGFSMSRTRAATDITSEKVQLNFQVVTNGAKAVKVGDKISFRGRGRLEVIEIGGKTKKGRISVLLHRYL